jgi:hypothetical protein
LIASAVEVGAGIAGGAALGFVLGVAIMSTWERFSDPRVADIGHSYGTTGIPTSLFDDITRGRGAALIDRWLALSSKPSTRVALIPTSPKLEPIAGHAVEWLSDLHAQRTKQLGRGGAGIDGGEPGGQAQETLPAARATSPAARPSWRSRWHPEAGSGAPEDAPTSSIEALPAAAEVSSYPPIAESLVFVTTGSDPESTPEAEAQRSDVVVLIVEADTRGKDLMESVWTLEHFGHRPEWILLVGSIRKSRRAMKRARSKSPS